ncbi:hypothetical protein [Winslowiella toletana]|uniref:hypothetical protein n=1 Tax=Winslowiella toletana TaxID=92490 RepID=UPI0028BD7252|nr:hypothetical protein [Winslowiella toletana]WNN43060.1 hypothetical protein RIN69_15285 [Winslowiella toletana]
MSEDSENDVANASTIFKQKKFPPDEIEDALIHIDTNEAKRAYNRSQYLERRRNIMSWCDQPPGLDTRLS